MYEYYYNQISLSAVGFFPHFGDPLVLDGELGLFVVVVFSQVTAH